MDEIPRTQGELADAICLLAGVTDRLEPGSAFLTKKELLQLYAWMQTMQRQQQVRRADA